MTKSVGGMKRNKRTSDKSRMIILTLLTKSWFGGRGGGGCRDDRYNFA